MRPWRFVAPIVVGAWLTVAAAAARAAPARLAIVPLGETGLSAEEAAAIERGLVDAVAALPGVTVVNLGPSGRLTAPRAGSPLALEGHPATRAQALGKTTGATRALTADVARLGEGLVVYLQAIDPSNGRSLASTTASLTGVHPLPAADQHALRAALVRVVDPARYVGWLALRLDVKGAEVQIDGRRLTEDPGHVLELPAGTHALRVTHPAYHDFLRFLDVEFDRTVTLEVPLAAYPLAEGEMSEAQRRAAPPSGRPLPWYRRWWALGAAGLLLAGATTAIVWAARPGLSMDRVIYYRAVPTP
jgi:hypothetical protein